jgi:hypothetical protein
VDPYPPRRSVCPGIVGEIMPGHTPDNPSLVDRDPIYAPPGLKEWAATIRELEVEHRDHQTRQGIHRQHHTSFWSTPEGRQKIENLEVRHLSGRRDPKFYTIKEFLNEEAFNNGFHQKRLDELIRNTHDIDLRNEERDKEHERFEARRDDCLVRHFPRVFPIAPGLNESISEIQKLIDTKPKIWAFIRYHYYINDMFELPRENKLDKRQLEPFHKVLLNLLTNAGVFVETYEGDFSWASAKPWLAKVSARLEGLDAGDPFAIKMNFEASQRESTVIRAEPTVTPVQDSSPSAPKEETALPAPLPERQPQKRGRKITPEDQKRYAWYVAMSGSGHSYNEIAVRQPIDHEDWGTTNGEAVRKAIWRFYRKGTSGSQKSDRT